MNLNSRVEKLESRARPHAPTPIILLVGGGEVAKYVHPAALGWCPALSGKDLCLVRIPGESPEDFHGRAIKWMKGTNV
ncbi:MAG: hypothetical protein IPN00_06985 [Hydrogenophilales bacterium]|nr:hypothetical protein [Hydrogenophilales bacterium]